MNRNVIISASFIFLYATQLMAAAHPAEPNDVQTVEKTEIVIVGTIHGGHYKNEKYSPEVLRDIILKLKPDAILNELPLSHVDPNNRPIHREHNKHPEGWASDTAAAKLGIRQIPYDRADRNENYKRTNYFKRQNKYMSSVQKWAQEHTQNDPNCVDLKLVRSWSDASYTQGYLDINGLPENINSEGYDRLIRVKHTLYKEVVPELFRKYPGYETLAEEGNFFNDQWENRNKIMAENIVRISSEYQGKRLVVLTGSEHRYILKDLLKEKDTIELKEFWQIENSQ